MCEVHKEHLVQNGGNIMAKVFNIVQYIKHPITGERLLDRNTIEEVLASYKLIKEFGYILHDSDFYTEEDEVSELESLKDEWEKLPKKKNKIKLENYIKKNHYKIAGNKKAPHWHIVLRFDRNMQIETIAKWFGISMQYVELPKGRQSFLDCIQYLTHESEKEQKAGKYRYDDSKVIANFDWRARLDELKKKREKYGSKSEKEYYRNAVCYNGLSIKELIKENKEAYLKDMNFLDKCRGKYLSEIADMPSYRINIYVNGKGGVGKNTMCKALAKALFPDVDDCFFEIGGQNTTFDGYDGQPVVIWNDFRSIDLITRFGRGEVFDIFDTHPTGAKHNVKYSSVKLVNPINIINGIEDYQVFLDGISGEYTDKNGNQRIAENKDQSYRRFPIIISLKEESFSVLLNKGYLNSTRDFLEYIIHQNVKGSFANVAQQLEGAAREQVEHLMLQPILEVCNIVKKKESNKIKSIEDIPKEFKEYGVSFDNDNNQGFIKATCEESHIFD